MARQRKQYSIEELRELVHRVSCKVRQLRQGLGISQSELARRSGVAHSTINEIENGVARDLQISTVCQLARGLKVTSLHLLAESDMILADPDGREFVEAVGDIEACCRVLGRIRDRFVRK